MRTLLIVLLTSIAGDVLSALLSDLLLYQAREVLAPPPLSLTAGRSLQLSNLRPRSSSIRNKQARDESVYAATDQGETPSVQQYQCLTTA